jgi:hypothetical protein
MLITTDTGARPVLPPATPSGVRPPRQRPTPHHAARYAAQYAARLDRDWDRTRLERRSLRHARSWATLDEPFDRCARTCTDLGAIIELTDGRHTGPGTGNDALIRLVRVAAHDDLAARVVLQRILPGLITRAAPYRPFERHADPIEVVVPAAWIAIKTFDFDRRHGHLAAALISDAIFQAFRRPSRRRSAGERPAATADAFDDLVAPDATVALVELAEVLRDARTAGVPAEHVDLLVSLARTADASSVASNLRITTRGMRYRRTRAIRAVQEVLVAA